ncbi:hypothetical protein QEG98_07860 [Myxococcus sp. MxC21-1]|uniref:hypothetical protein n=1 Tax=Myxococcus sp. MxC21-1 TaxID=3041439 RepID=UPI00293183DA|nr:hypothetical protein [Myxococcus sp. MxC21-1]WNZ63622.1 hypothetical protein QEG98_07860 [Myxococcus sp. MxC21-1]
MAFLSVESCGTGSGFLHGDPEPEVAHFRAKLRLASFDVERWGTFQPFLAGGFAEAQVGRDDPGFQFKGTDRRRVATAGPEGASGCASSARWPRASSWWATSTSAWRGCPTPPSSSSPGTRGCRPPASPSAWASDAPHASATRSTTAVMLSLPPAS